jgi:hypothetical protein
MIRFRFVHKNGTAFFIEAVSMESVPMLIGGPNQNQFRYLVSSALYSTSKIVHDFMAAGPWVVTEVPILVPKEVTV